MDFIDVALHDLLDGRKDESRIELKGLPSAFFDYFEITEAEKAA